VFDELELFSFKILSSLLCESAFKLLLYLTFDPTCINSASRLNLSYCLVIYSEQDVILLTLKVFYFFSPGKLVTPCPIVLGMSKAG